MKTYVLNLFIVDDDSLKLAELKNYLDNRFGTSISISIFNNNESMLKKIERYTNIVIADFSLEEGSKILNTVREINPKTEFIMLSNQEDIALEIISFQTGSVDYVIQGEKLWNKKSLIYKIASSPIRLILGAFGANKLRAMF